MPVWTCLFAALLRREKPCDPLGRGGFRSSHCDKNPAPKQSSYSRTVPKVCPTLNITVNDNPVFGNNCEKCYACIHLCPQNAIHLRSERSGMRWRNPETSLDEIIAANNRIKPDIPKADPEEPPPKKRRTSKPKKSAKNISKKA